MIIDALGARCAHVNMLCLDVALGALVNICSHSHLIVHGVHVLCVISDRGWMGLDVVQMEFQKGFGTNGFCRGVGPGDVLHSTSFRTRGRGSPEGRAPR